MLRLVNVEACYGGTRVLCGISMEVPEGKTVALLGSNGAGKSTLLKAIVGLLKPTAGAIEFAGRRIDGLRPQAIVGLGISLVPEGRQLFPELTVLENLWMGAYIRQDRDGVRADIKWVMELFPVLGQRQVQRAATLSGGEQQMLAIGRGLMARPKLMMIDELSLGLAPLVVKAIFDALQTIRAQGVTVLLVEQRLDEALSFADFAYVVVNGVIALSGTGHELLHSSEVKRAYLGEATPI